MNRREFVAGAGVVAGASLLVGAAPGITLPAQAAEPLPIPEPEAAGVPGKIDVHQHIVPPFYADALQRHGLAALAGQALPAWAAEQAVALMDRQGIAAAITSIAAPGVHFGDDRAANELARRCNDFAAELTLHHSGRFGHFAVLPLPATELACAEAMRALETLKADGVVLLASTAGRFLGDPQFDELMAELDRRQATVFVHPNLHASSETLGLSTPGFLLEVACDITRAAVNLILTGTLERYPRINWILAQAGGFLPYAAWRISLANALPEFSDHAPQGVLTYMRRFYFDTALAPAAYSMAVLKELVPARQILFGSDFPYADDALVATQLEVMATSTVWSASELAGINRGHALSLFPRFAGKAEAVPAAPVYEQESTAQWMGRMAKKPLGALAQQLRD